MTCAIADAGRVKHLGGHSFLDKSGVCVHKVDDTFVILGVLVIFAVALYHFEGLQINLYRFYNGIANSCRQHQRVLFEIIGR